MARKLNDENKRYLLSLKAEDITFDILLELFADRAQVVDGKTKIIPSRMEPSDEFDLSKDEYFNTTNVNTTAGIFIYNKLIIERDFKDITGYQNVTINGGTLTKIEDMLSNALLNDKINTNQMNLYFNRTQWLAMQLHSVLSGSFTMKSLKPLPSVMKERDRLLKENKDKLDRGDVTTAAKIEKHLLDMANKELDGDGGLDLYKSGARGSWGNNFKNISVMKGPIFNPVAGEFDIIKSNFMEGIRKEDIVAYANSVVTGAYPKAIGTATSGYFSKQIIAALQAVVLDKEGSDCGSKGRLKIVLHPHLAKDADFRYVDVGGGKLELITAANFSKFVGKEIKLRSPMYCVGKKLCRTCAGLMYEKLAIDNLGLTAARVSSTLLNLSMKKFHDSSAKLATINIKDMII